MAPPLRELYTIHEIATELNTRLDEADLTSSLTVLTSLEATFRIDYIQRCYLRPRDAVSRVFRLLHNAKGTNVSLEDAIFAVWAVKYPSLKKMVGELRGAFKFRHWLAHGRYWTPKLGRRYDFADLYALADSVSKSFPFL